MVGGGPAHTGRASGGGPGVESRVGWCATPPKGRVWSSYPAVANGSIFVGNGIEEGEGSATDWLSALDATSGDRLWEMRAAGRFIGTPAVADGTVVVSVGARGRGIVQGFDARTGEGRWRTRLDAELGAAPTVVDGSVFVSCQDDTVRSLRLDDGSERWRFTSPTAEDETTATTESKAPDLFGGNFRWTPTVADDIVYVGSSAFVGGVPGLFAIDAKSGELLWETLTFVSGMVTVVNGTVIANGMGKSLTTANAATGNRGWRTETEHLQTSAPATDGEAVYVGGERLFAFDIDGGDPLWQKELAAEDSIQPVVAGDSVYAFAENRVVVVGTDGTIRGRIRGPIGVPFAIAGRVLFALTGVRRLQAYVPADRGTAVTSD